MDQIQDGQDAQILVARAERFNAVFRDNLDQLRKEEKILSESLPKIMIEIEELRKIRKALVLSLEDTIKTVLKEEIKTLSDSLSHDFMEKATQGLQEPKDAFGKSIKDLTNYLTQEKDSLKMFLNTSRDDMLKTLTSYKEEVQQFKQDVESVLASLKKPLAQKRQRLTLQGLLICGVFCMASALTGAGLFYFFPQHVYTPDKKIAKHLVLGEIVWDNFTKLSPKDQDILVEGVKKYMILNKEKK